MRHSLEFVSFTAALGLISCVPTPIAALYPVICYSFPLYIAAAAKATAATAFLYTLNYTQLPDMRCIVATT